MFPQTIPFHAVRSVSLQSSAFVVHSLNLLQCRPFLGVDFVAARDPTLKFSHASNEIWNNFHEIMAWNNTVSVVRIKGLVLFGFSFCFFVLCFCSFFLLLA